MFRIFLSWRYLRARRTNLIGIVGIFLAVGALIMILSIMTGFLDESRATVRGSLSDIVVQPQFSDDSWVDPAVHHPFTAMSIVLEDERVEAASARLTWPAMISFEGGFNNTITDDDINSK